MHQPPRGPHADDTVGGDTPQPVDPAPGIVTLNAAKVVLGEQQSALSDLFLSLQPDEMDRLTIPTATLQISDMLTGRDQLLVHGRLTLGQLMRLQTILAETIDTLSKGWQACSD